MPLVGSTTHTQAETETLLTAAMSKICDSAFPLVFVLYLIVLSVLSASTINLNIIVVRKPGNSKWTTTVLIPVRVVVLVVAAAGIIYFTISVTGRYGIRMRVRVWGNSKQCISSRDLNTRSYYV